MEKLKKIVQFEKGQWIRFSTLDEMTARPVELVGKVLGFANQFPDTHEMELADLGFDYYIVEVPRPFDKTKHLIHITDFLSFEKERSVGEKNESIRDK